MLLLSLVVLVMILGHFLRSEHGLRRHHDDQQKNYTVCTRKLVHKFAHTFPSSFWSSTSVWGFVDTPFQQLVQNKSGHWQKFVHCKYKHDLPLSQISDPMRGKILFSFAPSSNSIFWVANPRRFFELTWRPSRALSLKFDIASGATER